MKDNEGKSKKFGFVCFKDYDAAKNACESLNGHQVQGAQLFVT
jgi:RNA recognition motif-containing protein